MCSELEVLIEKAKILAQELSKTGGSRELSLVITKLEEAQLWLSKILKKG